MKALIKVGYGCNENCTFCHTLDVRHIDGSSDEVVAKIQRAKALGHTMVVLSGGEPTTRPELLDWGSLVARLDMDLGLVTNGLMLAYPELVERLLERRLRYVYMSLHGGTPRVHNSLVRADTFGEAMRALANLSGRGLDLTINCVVARQNVAHLRELVDALRPFPDVTVKFSMVQPKGGGVAHFESLVPRVSEVAAAVVDAIGYAGGRGRHDGIPLCLLPGLEDRYADLKTDDYATMVEIGEPDFFPVDDKAKLQPEPCRDCTLRGPCPGLYAEYHQHFGHDELRPRTDGPRANSFNFIFESLVPAVSETGECPLYLDGTTPWDRGRTLFARHDGRIGRFRAVTRDFADVEIEHLKHDLGQVYLDASRKPAPDDFPRDLVPLRRSRQCDPCDKKPHCTGLWEPIHEDWFSRDDERVRALLAGLSGRVLDVGCGEGPYDDILQPLVSGGQIRYLGIDPDAQKIAALRARRPWGELRVGDAESLAERSDGTIDLAAVDHVLILRAWNHLRDPGKLLARLAELPPGATLTIADNVAFGLLRTALQARRAESSAARREHFHNHGSDDVLRLTRDLPFELLEHRAVSPETSNQWLVRFRRL
jgi:MoaA/NifB/PqqE/SkfB family radical SAM enzyme/SAM-dependent methyltransferase